MSLLTCLVREDASPSVPGALEALGRSCSPRVELHGSDAVIVDTGGLARVCGPPEVVAQEIVQLASTMGITIRLATASTRTAAWLLAHARAGITIVAPGAEAATLASLTIGWLGVLIDLDHVQTASAPEQGPSRAEADAGRTSTAGVLRGRKASGGRHYRMAPAPQASLPPRPPVTGGAALRQLTDAYRERFATFERWGLQTLGDIAALPRQDVHARMGLLGVRLHQAACGQDVTPLVPIDEVQPFSDRVQLEWPIEGLEPLSFVLSRQFDRLSLALEQADRGAVTVTTRLVLVTKATHERMLHLPAPLRDPRVLRTLVLLDLESHPPSAAIDIVELVLEVTPGPIVQGSLLAETLPSIEDVTTLVARLGALMGESRVGAPALVDTHDARGVAMRPFHVASELRRGHLSAPTPAPVSVEGPPRQAFRRFRVPLTARVTLDRGVPVRVMPSGRGLAGGAVVASAGPWRTSGGWWRFNRASWDRDEWDVALAPGGVYRIARHRVTGIWEIEGLFD